MAAGDASLKHFLRVKLAKSYTVHWLKSKKESGSHGNICGMQNNVSQSHIYKRIRFPFDCIYDIFILVVTVFYVVLV